MWWSGLCPKQRILDLLVESSISGDRSNKRIGEDISLFLRTVVEIGSRLQDELDDWDSKLVISSRMAGLKDERGGVRVGSGGQGGRCCSANPGFSDSNEEQSDRG